MFTKSNKHIISPRVCMIKHRRALALPPTGFWFLPDNNTPVVAYVVLFVQIESPKKIKTTTVIWWKGLVRRQDADNLYAWLDVVNIKRYTFIRTKTVTVQPIFACLDCMQNIIF